MPSFFIEVCPLRQAIIRETTRELSNLSSNVHRGKHLSADADDISSRFLCCAPPLTSVTHYVGTSSPIFSIHGTPHLISRICLSLFQPAILSMCPAQTLLCVSVSTHRVL